MPEVPTTAEIRLLTDPVQRLVQAGARLLIDDGFRILAAGVSPNAVARVAGRTRRTFYDHFETKEEFTREVMLEYLRVSQYGALSGEFEEAFAGRILEAEGDVVESIRSLSREIFTIRSASQSPQMQAISAALAHSDPAIRQRLGEYGEEVDSRFARLIEEAIARWGLKLRPPWTPLMLTISVRAMATGLYARAGTGTATFDSDFFGDNVLVLLSALTLPIHRPDESLDTAFRRTTRTSPASWRESRAPQALVNRRRQVLEVIASLLGEVGASDLTFDHIAHAADVSPAAVSAAFESVDHAIGQAIIDTLPALRREATFDIQTDGLDCRTVLVRHFARVATWVGANQDFGSYCLIAMAEFVGASGRSSGHDDAGPTLEVMRSLSESAIYILTHARSNGDVRAEVDTIDVAVLSTHTLIARAVLNPETSPTEAAEWIVNLLFDGIASTPGPASTLSQEQP